LAGGTAYEIRGVGVERLQVDDRERRVEVCSLLLYPYPYLCPAPSRMCRYAADAVQPCRYATREIPT
ncbi:hypothetical protein, partial [Streptomyces sp. NPDC002851]